MPEARDEIEAAREAERLKWQRAFDRLAAYLRELRETQDDDDEDPGAG